MTTQHGIISIIVAMAENRVIGRDGDLPWHISADLRRFKKLTTGHAIIMGRKTYESIGRPLPRRRSIVISGNVEFTPDTVEVARGLDEALAMARGDDEAFVIGGARVYREALPRADRLYITHVHAKVDGNVFFPEFDQGQWRPMEESPRQRDEASGLEYSFQIYERAAGVQPSG